MAQTLVDLFEHRVNTSGTRAALRYKTDGHWLRQSWKDWWVHAERLAAGLMSLGVERGERVALLCSTRVQWAWFDLAVQMCGAVVVPLFPASTAEHLGAILRETDARLILAEDPGQIDKVFDAGALPSLRHIVYVDVDALLDEPDWKGRTHVRFEEVVGRSHAFELLSLDKLADRGRALLTEDGYRVLERRRQIGPDDLASIVYTSGTGAAARGAMLTHANFVAQIDIARRLEFLGEDDVQLLSLPLAHIFARTLLTSAIGVGAETAFAESVTRIPINLQEVSPTIMASVPRVFEVIQGRLLSQTNEQPVRGRLVRMALEMGRQISRSEQMGEPVGRLARLEHEVVSRLSLGRLREFFGPNLRYLIAGGAPLSPQVAEFFHAAGLLILEGYGLTETCGMISLNLPESYRFGTVGRPVPAVDVTLAEDQEILVRGPTVMRGYVGAGAGEGSGIDADGWFHTGDLGRFDRDGFLIITGRKKDVIVTTAGKIVSPRHIEGLLEQSPFVRNAVVLGDGRAFVAALVTLDEAAVWKWAAVRGITDVVDFAELTQHPRVRELVDGHVQAVNRSLPSYETIRKFAILERDFSVHNDEITASGKLRRSTILEHFEHVVESFYTDPY